MEKNAAEFKNFGVALEQNASPDARVLVVGEFMNTNAAVLKKYAPKIPVKHITGLALAVQNRATRLVGEKPNAPSGNLKNLTIWGNLSGTIYPDMRFSYYKHSGSLTPPPQSFLEPTFLHRISSELQTPTPSPKTANLHQKTGSIAAAICDHVRYWAYGNQDQTNLIDSDPVDLISMGFASDGSKQSYQIPAEIFFSFPVNCFDWNCEIVQGYDFSDEYSLRAIGIAGKELVNDRKIALQFLEPSQ